MRRGSIRITSLLTGAVALALFGWLAWQERRPDSFTIDYNPSYSPTGTYNGAYGGALGPTDPASGVFIAPVEGPPSDIPLRWFAYPGLVALLLAAVLLLVAARRSRWSVVALSATATVAAAVSEDPGLRTAVGSVLLRLAVVLVPAMLTLGSRALLERRAATS